MARTIPPLRVDLIKELKKVEKNKRRQNALIPYLQREDIKEAIGLEIIDAILERTNKGYDKNNKKFKRYSKSYRDTRTFRIYKGKQRRVDLKLTGDMQSSVTLNLEIREDGVIEIIIPSDDTFATNKAHGHIYGGGNLPVRDFWGLPNTSEMQKIMDRSIRDASDSELTEQIALLEAEKAILAGEIAREQAPTITINDIAILLGGS